MTTSLKMEPWSGGYGASNGPVAVLSSSQFVCSAGNAFLITDVSNGKKEVVSAQGIGIQTFGACSKHGLLAYVTQEMQPALVLHSPSASQTQSAVLKGEQKCTAVAVSSDGKQVLLARGHPCPNLEVYCCKSVIVQMNLITESSVEHAVLDLSVNPLDNQQAFSTSTSAVFLHSIITSVGKKHLMNRSVLVPNSTATCHAFFLKSLLPYLFRRCRVRRAAEGMKFEDEERTGLAISSIVTTTEMVIVALAESSTCFCCSHFSASSEQQVLAQLQLDMCSNIKRMVICGLENSHLVVTPQDGCLILARMRSGGGSVSLASESLLEGHTQRVTSASPAPGRGCMATCSSDGSLCLWDCSTGICKHRRTFNAHLTVVSTVPNMYLLALGSQCGVLRIIHASSGLPVLHRKRVSKSPMEHISTTSFGKTGVLACLAGTCALLVRINESGAISKLQEVSLSAPALSVALVPAAANEAMLYMLASLATSELVCTLHLKEEDETDVALLDRRIRTATPMLSMVCCSVRGANSLGHVYGIGLDHTLRCYDLPVDANSWTVTKGRPSRPLEQLEVGASLTSMHLAVHSTRLHTYAALGSASGNVIMAELRAPSARHEMQLGDAAQGGITAVAYDRAGSHVLCGTADGAVIFCNATGIKASPETAELKPEKCVLASDMDRSDNASESVVEFGQPLRPVQRPNSQDALKASAEQNSVVARLTALKQRLVSLIQQNEEVPETEQVPRLSLAIHDALMASLRKEGEQQVAILRQSLQRKCRAKLVEWQRIKAQCWDNMLHPSQALTGVRKSILVYSYSIPEDTGCSQRLQQVNFLLGVEAAEWRSTGRRSKKSLRVFRAMDSQAEGRGDEEGSGVEEDNVTGLYTEWDLSTFQRRLVTKMVIEGKLRQKKEEFNDKFAAVQKLQVAGIDVLMDQNQRLKDAVDELDCMGYKSNSADIPKPVEVQPNPDEDAAFGDRGGGSAVHGGEKVNAGSRFSGLEGHGHSLVQEVYERALKAMMNGELHSKSKKNQIWVLEKPIWMYQSQSEWTDEQKQLAAQFQAEQKRIDDFRESRRQAVEAEIRSIKSTVEETCSKVDLELEKLCTLKHLTEKAVRELELRAIAACAGADALDQLGPKGAEEAHHAVHILQKQEQQLHLAMQTIKEKVNEVQYALDQQTAQDRQMERSFKKDFQELPEEVFSQLQTISKTWRRCKPVDNLLAASNSTDLLVLDVCKRDFCDVVEETPPADQPQGCDTSTWQLFMKWYQSKAQSENSLIALQSDLNEMRSLSDYISQEYERVSKKCQACIDRSVEVGYLHSTIMHDIKLSLELKNGGVEIESASVDSSVSKDAVFLNLDKVDALNRVVREKAGGCVKVLEEIRDFKSGIYQLLFECKRLDMEGEDASNRVRDLQLLRVTSEVNQLFANPGKASRKSTLEVQQMEAQMQHNLLLHKKSLNDRQQHFSTLTTGICKKQKLNKQLQVQIMDLADFLDGQIPAIEAMTAHQDNSRPRAKGLAASKKLRDIARAQRTEVENLKKTLHKLHLRSYPAFVDPKTEVPDPHVKQTKG